MPTPVITSTPKPWVFLRNVSDFGEAQEFITSRWVSNYRTQVSARYKKVIYRCRNTRLYNCTYSMYIKIPDDGSQMSIFERGVHHHDDRRLASHVPRGYVQTGTGVLDSYGVDELGATGSNGIAVVNEPGTSTSDDFYQTDSPEDEVENPDEEFSYDFVLGEETGDDEASSMQYSSAMTSEVAASATLENGIKEEPIDFDAASGENPNHVDPATSPTYGYPSVATSDRGPSPKRMRPQTTAVSTPGSASLAFGSVGPIRIPPVQLPNGQTVGFLVCDPSDAHGAQLHYPAVQAAPTPDPKPNAESSQARPRNATTSSADRKPKTKTVIQDCDTPSDDGLASRRGPTARPIGIAKRSRSTGSSPSCGVNGPKEQLERRLTLQKHKAEMDFLSLKKHHSNELFIQEKKHAQELFEQQMRASRAQQLYYERLLQSTK